LTMKNAESIMIVTIFCYDETSKPPFHFQREGAPAESALIGKRLKTTSERKR
jgi:hypothetical protein